MQSVEIIFKHFPNLSDKQKQQFTQLQDLYTEWNAKINVISRKDIDELYTRHILHSLGIAKIIQFKANTEILDVGTGGGFPGIPLAIMFPDSKFTLADSITKKITVVDGVKDALGLTNVKTINGRVEKIDAQFDFIVSRAVTNMSTFYNWIQHKFIPYGFNKLDNGILYLKGGDLEEELKAAKRPYKLYELSNFFEDEFFETKKVVYIKKK